MLFARWAAEWRHDYANLALGGGNLLILLLGLQLHSRIGWQISFALVGLTSFWAWYANLKRYRTVADTPTSRVASAPQGYIELVGRGQQPPGAGLASPISGLPCLWYRYRIERKNGDRWEHVESGMSHDTFGISDGSGQVLIDPDGAEIMTSRKQISNTDGYRSTEWTLIEGETIYVIGEHVTLGGPNAMLDKKSDLSTLLTEWKRDKTVLLARFDANRDGEISLDEWAHARQAAADEVDRAHLDIRLRDGIHLMRQPAPGRPFLVANREVTALVRHFRLWSWAHLVLIMAALLGLAFVERTL
ncbi:MAG: E3 ubiquitin ligase family protein [Thiobacillus sp.]|nr:E3 ubiquitin ligase family protein [Thiobacillus sp.]